MHLGFHHDADRSDDFSVSASSGYSGRVGACDERLACTGVTDEAEELDV